ncbi:DUF805 domain-containing protein [Bacillus sp. BRMEA1]|uniref:DUF805 domain-containing protein n=1 Tax=Neobacillus endophyticus TaxID=2738405 RepID=UPI00156724FF|nr:DUF805 domain-containing protein [Neobacillus endophyticus]NRD80146.1 DUF805 domain-containing protein [Neobacillus endophyticus]
MYLQALKKYAEFKVWASRSEYWTFTLINDFILFPLECIIAWINHPKFVGDTSLSYIIFELFYFFFLLVVILPNLAVNIRKLYDSDMSGWWLLFIFLLLPGWIVLLVFCVLSLNEDDN